MKQHQGKTVSHPVLLGVDDYGIKKNNSKYNSKLKFIMELTLMIVSM